MPQYRSIVNSLRLAAIGCITAVLFGLGCGDGGMNLAPGGPGTPNSGMAAAPEERVGSVALDLQAGNAITIDNVGYDISGGTFHRAGNVNVSNSAGASVLVDSIPFGTGYVVQMTAAGTSGPPIQCSGSATFSVTSADVTGVPIHLTCQEQQASKPAPIPRAAMWALFLLLGALGCALAGRREQHRAEAP